MISLYYQVDFAGFGPNDPGEERTDPVVDTLAVLYPVDPEFHARNSPGCTYDVLSLLDGWFEHPYCDSFQE